MRPTLFALLFALAAGVPQTAGAAEFSAAEIERAIADNPTLAALVEADPAKEAAIRERLRAAGATSAQALHEESMRVGREFANEMLPRLARYAPDGTMTDFVDATLAALEEAAAQGGARCHGFLTGGKGGAPMPRLSPQTGERINDALFQVIVDGTAGQKQPLLSEEGLISLLEGAAARAFELAGDTPIDFDTLGILDQLPDEESKTVACRTTILLYRAIRELPPAQSGALLRSLFAAG